MKREHLLDAIGRLDDDLIVEAEERPKVRRLPLWQTATAAAAALVVCMGLYLLPATQPAGMAEPEAARGTNGAVFDVADGVLMDGAFDGYKYKTDYEAQASLRAPSAAENKDVAGEMGIMEPQFFTERGFYALAALDFMQTLPEDARYLGELSDVTLEAWSYPAVRAKELVGQSVWESEDGEYLYVQLPEGGWWTAKLNQ